MKLPALLVGGCRRAVALRSAGALRGAAGVGGAGADLRIAAGLLRGSRSTSTASAPTTSALAASARRLRDAVLSHEVTAEVAKEADAPVDQAAAVERLRHELRQAEEDIEVFLLGEALSKEGRKVIAAPTPVGPGGSRSVRKVNMVLPTVEDVSRLLSARKAENPRVEKPAELADILEKYLQDKFLGRRTDHVALLAAWGPKALGDAEGEYAEVAALMALSLRAYRAALRSAREDYQFEVHRAGDGKECLVMPPSNFALLGLKDAFHMLLQGYRVILVVQPRFFPHFREVQKDLVECGLPANMVEVLPGITPEADPEVLHEVLRHVDRLQFTGSSAMFANLVTKAYQLGNLRLEHGGEVSGLNKVRLDGVSVTHPAAAAGTAWAAMANNGELCTSASLVEFDPATGDTAEQLKKTVEAHSFRLGRDPLDPSLDVLLRDGKTEALEVLTEVPPGGFREWWEKKIFAVPRGGTPNVRTNQSLGHCIYSTSISKALEAGVREEASCVYCVGVPEDPSAPSARAGTTGCKIPESVFGGMKTYTSAVAGDHDGVGSPQTLFNTVKRRGANWRDQDEAYAEYKLTETAEMLLDYLSPQEQRLFERQISNVLEVFAAFQPQVSNPYPGQSLVNGEGRSQLVTLPALRPVRKNMLIPRGVGLPEDIVKAALLIEMSPLREVPVDLHLLGAQEAGKLRVTDPLKSFLRVVEKRLGWRLHWHHDTPDLVAELKNVDYPPYFYCVKDRHLLPVELLIAVAEKGGYLYEGLPNDALSIFRWMTATQAWTASCTEAQVQEATSELQRLWKEVGLRQEPHEAPEVLQPKRRSEDVGGGFGGQSLPDEDKEWAELSDDESSSSDDEVAKKDAKDGAKGSTPAAAAAGA